MAELELVRVRCTSCGADFENVKEDQEVFTCKRFGCGATFRVSHGKLFAMIEKEKAEKIANHRKALYEALDAFQPDSVFEYASVIIGMLPDDFRAGIAQRLAQMRGASGDPRALREYLDSAPAATESEFIEIFPYIIKYAGYTELKCLARALPVYVKGEAIEPLKAQLEQAFRTIERANRDYADISRDVFLCHSSENSEFAEEVYASLLRDGRKVWISSHNLAPHSMNYWQNIENAIRKCDVFVVIASKDAMMSHDVQREIMIAQKLNKLRAEIKIDDYHHTEVFKDFFDGISWIDASKDKENALRLLNKRVMLLAKQAQEEKLNAGKAKNTAPNASNPSRPAGSAQSDFTVDDVSDFVNKLIHVIKTILAFLFPMLKKYLLKAGEKAVHLAGEAVEGIKKSEAFNNLKTKVAETFNEFENASEKAAQTEASEDTAYAEEDYGESCEEDYGEKCEEDYEEKCEEDLPAEEYEDQTQCELAPKPSNAQMPADGAEWKPDDAPLAPPSLLNEEDNK